MDSTRITSQSSRLTPGDTGTSTESSPSPTGTFITIQQFLELTSLIIAMVSSFSQVVQAASSLVRYWAERESRTPEEPTSSQPVE